MATIAEIGNKGLLRYRGLEGDVSRVAHAIRLKRKWGDLIDCLDGFDMSETLKKCSELITLTSSIVQI